MKPSEWRWVAVFAVAVMAFTTVPYAVGFAAQRDGWQFGGFLIGVEDGNAYLARMRQGAEGQWLDTLAFSTEAQAGAFLYPLLHLLGALAGPEPLAEIVVYHAARVLCGLFLLAASYAFLSAFVPDLRWRRLGLGLVALGGGLGWLLALLLESPLFGSLPPDFILPEAFSYLILFNFVHLALARALLLLGLLAYLRGRGGWAGLALLAAGLAQPLAIGVAWAVMGAHVALGWLLRGRAAGWAWRTDLKAAAIAAALTAPLLAYVTLALRLDPVLRQWLAQNLLPSPPPLHYLLAYVGLLLPALVGARALWQRAPRLAVLAAAWVLLAFVLAYLPVPPQRRLLEGVQLPLVALAVVGLGSLAARWRRPATLAVLALSLPTTLLLWLGALVAARTVAAPIFLPPDEVAAFAWLRANAAPGDAGLAAYATGNALPAYTPLRAYIGHGPETVFLTDKRAQVSAFYLAVTRDAVRRDLLRAAGLDYVIFGPNERQLGAFDPATADYLGLRFASGDYAVYAVVAP